MNNLFEIDALTKAAADALVIVRERAQKIKDEKESLERRLKPGLTSATIAFKEALSRLKAGIEDSGDLFKSPRTLQLHGFKIGFAKGKGKMEIEDADHAVALIKKYFPDQAERLIKVTEKPVKEALNTLSAAELRKLGITVIEAGDYVVVRPVDTDIDKFVKSILSSDDEEEDLSLREAA